LNSTILSHNVQEDIMNKSELVAAVAKHTGESQAAVGRVIDAMFETIGASIKKGNKVTIPGYLSVDKGRRAARAGRNPQTGATIQIAAANTVKVSAGSKLKAAVK
jgi:DNA-binding protein HU-beta